MIDLSPVAWGGGGIILTIVGILIKTYFDKKKDDRQEIKSARESESGIVETTKAALALVREEMQHMQINMATLRERNAGLEVQVSQLAARVNTLELENATLRARLG